MPFKFIVTFLLAFAIAGCSSTREFGVDPQVEVTDLAKLPKPEGAGVYRIGAQEVLEVTVVGSDLLTSKFITDGRGSINYPLVGEVPLAGLTPAEASSAIANRLRGYYVLDPQVIVVPEDLQDITFSVGGQVGKPGDYPVDDRTTLMRAINAAGGLDEYAEREEVLVFRTVAGQNYIGVYNLEAIQQGNYPDPAIYANDLVMVGDSPGERRLERILQFIPVLSTAVILVDRISRP
jgi:polysaccharide export outer membrane protein